MGGGGCVGVCGAGWVGGGGERKGGGGVQRRIHGAQSCGVFLRNHENLTMSHTLVLCSDR